MKFNFLLPDVPKEKGSGNSRTKGLALDADGKCITVDITMENVELFFREKEEARKLIAASGGREKPVIWGGIARGMVRYLAFERER